MRKLLPFLLLLFTFSAIAQIQIKGKIIDGLSNELKGKLSLVRPSTLAQAGRVDGMTPAALALLLAKIKQFEKKSA